MQNLSEQQLISGYKDSDDMNYIAELFKRYTHLSYSVSYKYLKDKDECKDAVMDIFEKLITDLKKYEIHNFSSWLHSTTRNYCLMKLRKTSQFDTFSENNRNKEEEHVEIDTFLHQSHAALLEAKEEMLSKAINELNEDQKICVELFYLKELSYVQIAEQTNYSLNQIKSYIQNGKRNLKLKLSTTIPDGI